jgi:hypothetical protein
MQQWLELIARGSPRWSRPGGTASLTLMGFAAGTSCT